MKPFTTNYQRRTGICTVMALFWVLREANINVTDLTRITELKLEFVFYNNVCSVRNHHRNSDPDQCSHSNGKQNSLDPDPR
jgi:hypothetical protein